MGVAGQVHQQVAQQPIDHPGFVAGVHGRQDLIHLLKGNRQFIQVVVAGLVDPWRLAGGANKGAGKQVGQCRVVLPVGDQTLEQVRAAQQRAVFGGGTAEGGVVAAAGAGMPAIEHEFLGAQTGQTRLFIQGRNRVDQFVPAGGRVDVDLDHAGVWGHTQQLDARVARRLVALDTQLELELGGAVLDGRDQRQIVFDALEWRHKHMQAAITDLHTQGGVNHIGGRQGFFHRGSCFAAEHRALFAFYRSGR